MALLDGIQFVSESDAKSGTKLDQELPVEFTADPEPGERPRRGRPPKLNAVPAAKRPPTAARLAKDVAADLATLIAGTAAVWGLQDRCCAPILEDQAQPIADALVAVLSRNPRLLAKFANADIVSMTLQSVALGRALMPVGKAIWTNHVSRTGEGEGHDQSDRVDLSGFPSYSGS